MTRTMLVVFSLAAVAAVVFAYQGKGGPPRPGKADKDLAAVRAVIEEQQAAWNRGDVEGFMAGYAKEEATTFISGDTLTRGWQTVLERYKRRYDSRQKMGTLSFTELDLKPLSEFYIMATGRWQLALEGGETPHGRFTLIFRRTVGGWRIIHDHTSSAD
ncbi:MAG TPA: nuclear transport factor 2 family protein [Pyrinomonadaceae bacterium]|nr:nuclear transport factor 2 family protein [Pyrinomonadaceae bacterium]